MADYERTKRCWDVGRFRYGTATVKPRPPGNIPSDALQSVISVRGHFNCCDLWVNLPTGNTETREAGWQDVALSMWAWDGEQRTMLVRKFGRDQEGILLPQTSRVERRVQACLLSVRGRACDGFEVLAETEDLTQSAEFDRYGEGIFRLEGWGDDSQNPNDDQGRTIVDPYAPRHKILTTSIELVVGNNEVLRQAPIGVAIDWPERDRRVYVTSYGISTDDATAREVFLEHTTGVLSPGPPVTTIVSSNWVGGGSGNDNFYTNYTYPQRGDPGGTWNVRLSAKTPPSTWYANLVGFVE